MELGHTGTKSAERYEAEVQTYRYRNRVQTKQQSVTIGNTDKRCDTDTRKQQKEGIQDMPDYRTKMNRIVKNMIATQNTVKLVEFATYILSPFASLQTPSRRR